MAQGKEWSYGEMNKNVKAEIFKLLNNMLNDEKINVTVLNKLTVVNDMYSTDSYVRNRGKILIIETGRKELNTDEMDFMKKGF